MDAVISGQKDESQHRFPDAASHCPPGDITATYNPEHSLQFSQTERKRKEILPGIKKWIKEIQLVDKLVQKKK